MEGFLIITNSTEMADVGYTTITSDEERVNIEPLYDGKNKILVILFLLFCGIGIFGNTMAIVTFLSCSQMRKKPINIFFTHQSVIDLIVCVFTVAEELIVELAINGQGICHLFHSKTLSNIALYTSTYNFVMLTIERQSAIVNPLQYQPEKVMKRLPMTFALEWLAMALVFAFTPATTVYRNGVCMVSMRMWGTVFMDLVLPYLFIISTCMPVGVMVVCYLRMIRALYRSSKTFKSTPGQANSIKLHAAQINLFQTCLLMLIVFLTCWLTSQSAVLLYILDKYSSLSNDHYSIGRLMVLINSVINPYIWAIRYDEFQNQLIHLFRLGKTVTKVNESTINMPHVSKRNATAEY